MAIILEGFDNSGKSTLAKHFGLEIVHPGPAPKTEAEEVGCLLAQEGLANKTLVMDRVTCLSSQAYNRNKYFEPQLKSALQRMIVIPHCVIIYCRPNLNTILDFSKHEVKSYDDPVKIAWLQANVVPIVARYDTLMSTIPHLRYDWTNPDLSIIEAALNAQFTMGDWVKWLDRVKT